MSTRYRVKAGTTGVGFVDDRPRSMGQLRRNFEFEQMLVITPVGNEQTIVLLKKGNISFMCELEHVLTIYLPAPRCVKCNGTGCWKGMAGKPCFKCKARGW